MKDRFISVFGSVMPVISLVFALLLFFTDAGLNEIAFFLVCVAMVIVGITLFLTGTDEGIIPAGQSIGEKLSHGRSVAFMIAIVFVISFLVTFADPDVMIFGDTVSEAFPPLNVTEFLFMISAGVGFLAVVSALKIRYNISQRRILIAGYGIVLILALMVPPEFFAMCFDAGTVSMGPISIPVLVALGLGLCSALRTRSVMDGFGMLSTAIIGPMIGVMLFCIYTGGSDVIVPAPMTYEFTFSFLTENLIQSVRDVLVALLPILFFFVLFQKIFLKYSWSSVKKMTVGVGIAGIGLILFLTGVYSGFLPVATEVGEALADINPLWVMLLGFAIGLLATVAEPTVTILCKQVEEVSNGTMKSRTLVIVLGLGVASFVAMGMGRIIYDVDLMYILIPGFAIAVILMSLCERNFSGVAFDAGAVAGGPMGVTLVMTMCAGLAMGLHGDAGFAMGNFGIITLMVLAPMIFVSALGIKMKRYNERNAIVNDL
ncbi:MAG: DUF1538 domain-containing protein [Methanomassiliicoccaceae archaeon]|nr:DUF1538 domain-containing protein [Methanomassiliicoccaceae archaeon]